MGAYDNMFSNASTFKVELDEWCVALIIKILVRDEQGFFSCKILRNATPKSLVILDGASLCWRMNRNLIFVIELGRGTSTFDGMAIASVSHV